MLEKTRTRGSYRIYAARRTEPQAQARRLQRIGMTCRHIQLAGAVDAIEHGEEEEKVLKRLGANAGQGNLAELSRRSVLALQETCCCGSTNERHFSLAPGEESHED